MTATPQQSMIVAASEYKPLTDMKYTKPKVAASGMKTVGILNAKTNKSTFISTPLMLSYGAQENDFDGSGKFSYDMTLQFPNDDWGTPQTNAFLQAMKDMESKILDDAVANSKEWFGKNTMSREVASALMNPILKYPKDKETGEPDLTRAPTLRVKIPFYDGVWKTEVYGLDGSPLYPNQDGRTPIDLIPKGAQVACVLQNSGIYFINGKFGTSWKLFQTVCKPKETLAGKCHISLSADDMKKAEESNVDADSEEELVLEEESVADEDESVADESVAEEESEAEPDQIVAPIPEPEPVVTAATKKKVVRRKKAPSAGEGA
jgi:hypothetical protein